MTNHPNFNALLDLSAAVSRHAYATALTSLDLAPDDRRRAIGMEFDAIEDASRVLAAQIGANGVEAAHKAILDGMMAKFQTLSLAALEQ